MLSIVNLSLYGLPWWGLFCYGFLSTFNLTALGSILTTGIMFASVWIFLGPLVILWWELHYFKFVKLVMHRPRQVKFLDRNFRRLVRRHSVYAKGLGLLTCFFTLGFFFRGIDAIRPYTNFLDSPRILGMTLVVLSISGYSIGYGFSGVFQAMALFKRIDVLRLEWMPFHYDKKGGFKFLASFALATAMAISSGSVVLLATIGIALKINNNFVWAVYTFTIFYMILIAATFVYPMYKTMLLASREKRIELIAVSTRLTQLYRQAMHPLNPLTDTTQELDRFDKYRGVEERIKAASVFPVDIGTFLKLLPFVSFPANIVVSQIKWDKVVQILLPHLKMPFH